MSGVRNITVPWVPLDEFDWSFARTGPLPWNLTVWCLLAVFTSLPIWMTVELTAWVLYAFERWSGIYFWSVLATTWGLSIRAIGFLLKFCVPQANWILTYVLSEVGWVVMVTGFSIVLWSRLHLVIPPSTRILRAVLAMIIIDGFLFHVPTVVFQYFISNSETHVRYLPYMDVMERVQVLAFSVQEAVISSVYIWGTLQMLKLSLNAKAKNTLAFLIIVQVAVVLADIPVIVLDYCNYFTLKAVIHSFIYAFKLQIEFVVLNEFKRLANGGMTGGNGSLGRRSDDLAPFNARPLDVPKEGNSIGVYNNSGVSVVVSAGGPPSSRANRSDSTGQRAEQPDALEAQYLGRYGVAM
ncbi:uncharacterized protein F4812DRAFT_458058 [Daldinia caldariorum]|uniref:uncharacterized protein n=1 Tax=Daldinia caldariorum TaxID=326644 RepID=UPI0020080AC5|nr:uncharacterized protein F4812DRAFT_458058 [Daldinia caldariorum]KAI1469522.1 hypothetical protein F4812DRAFT_458058 [Daldinia caldariorum]